MKYTIEGFGQAKLLEHGLDHRDAIFLRWFADFQQTDQMLCLHQNGISFFWLRHSYIAEQLPIIGLHSETSVRHYLKRLVDAGVLHRTTKADGEGRGSRAYYCIDSIIWRELTEKDHRPIEAGGEDEQRPDGDGGRDQRPEQAGDHDEQRPVEDGGNEDQRPGEDALIPPSEEDSSNRGEDTHTESPDGADPPPLVSESDQDPVKRVEKYLRHRAPTFWMSKPETQQYIRHFEHRHGMEALEAACRSYAREKTAKQISKYFDTDFPERLADLAKELEQKRTHSPTCDQCKRATPVLMDWDDDQKICPDCARRARDQAAREAS